MKSITMIIILFLIGFSFTGRAGYNKLDSNDYNLLFRTGTYQVSENIEQFISNFHTLTLENEVFFGMVQFHEIPNQNKRQLLVEGGIVLFDYMPGMSYYVTISKSANLNLLLQSDARAVIEIKPEYKLDFDLYVQDYPEHALRPGNKIELWIHYFNTLDQSEIINRFAERNIQYIETGIIPGYFLVSSPIDEIQWMASLPFIQFIEPVQPPAEPENVTGTTLHRSSGINTPHPLGRKYDGEGVNIMLQDDGIIGPHIDYHGRIGAQYISFNNGDHGDHIAGTIMGAGNRDPKARGMAPGSTIYVYGVTGGGYQGFNNISSHYFNPGIRITSTSYGNGCNLGYNSLARTMDQQSRLYPGLIHVFSAGNSGSENCGYGAGAGWGNITGGHKSAKNVIAVGALNLTDDLVGFSSRGPAFDGRIKPEVVAKGSQVYSTTNPNLYNVKSGTSMACPGVSGTLAQLYQAYRQFNDGEDPAGGLMKAIIMNSADDLGNPGPDFRFGFGRINALNAAQTIEGYRYDSAMIEQSEVITHYLEVPENTHEFRVMLYWTDFESSVGTTKALVNNLDLIVSDPDSIMYLPWVLSHFPHPDSLNAPARRAVDNMNNVEQVTITGPAAGTYEIKVNGSLIPQGPQQYFITWEFITSDIVITHPIGGDSFVTGETELVRWDSPNSNASFRLEYSTDNGGNWNLISDNISGNRRYHSWTPAGVVTGEALIRLSQNDKQVTNAYPFSIIGVPQNIQVDWVCDSAFRISWNEVFGAEAYQVSKLGDKFMDPVGTTSTNSFIVEDLSSNESWVTVQAIGPNSATGRRAYAINKQPGLHNCQGVDLAMTEITSAAWMVYNISCSEFEDFPFEVRIKNTGSEPVESFLVGYAIDDGLPVTQELDVVLLPDEAYIHLFPQTIGMSETGEYVLKAWVSHSEDNNHLNDTITRVLNLIDDNVISLYSDYIQNFDDFTRCVTWPICEQVVCDLSEGWINLTNLTQDDIDWRPWGGQTTTGLTGPSYDNTTGDETGNYLYLRAAAACFDREAILVSPCFDLTGAESATFSFYYHMYGIHIGRIHVDAFTDNTIYYDIMPPLVGEQGDEWKLAVIPLDNFVGGKVSFRFRGITGPGQLSDIAIDDVSVTAVGIMILPGDANCDGMVNVIDVVTTVNYITGENPDPFCFENADVNQDGIIDVVDVVGLINLITGDSKGIEYQRDSETAYISLNNSGVEFISDGTIAGLQFEIAGIDTRKLNVSFHLDKFEFATSVKGDKLLGLIYNLGNYTIPAGKVNLVSFRDQTQELEWVNVIAANTKAEPVNVIKQISESAISLLLNVYPNPSEGIFFVDVEASFNSQLNLSVFDMLGNQVMDVKEFSGTRGQHRFELELKNVLPAGVYFLRVQASPVDEMFETLIRHHKIMLHN